MPEFKAYQKQARVFNLKAKSVFLECCDGRSSKELAYNLAARSLCLSHVFRTPLKP
jgi:hypothetical protein